MKCLALDPLHIFAAVCVVLILVIGSFAAGASWMDAEGEP